MAAAVVDVGAVATVVDVAGDAAPDDEGDPAGDPGDAGEGGAVA